MNVIVILCDTLRRDHCGPYNQGKPLNQCWSAQAPDWIVPTPNMDRLAERGTIFRNAYCGSTPCMPARRDIYTGRYEFLERGWGPLEEEDLDLPRQVSGPPNKSIRWTLEQGHRVSSLITDHFHLWEKGSGNYHMGYTGFDFVRGCEADNWLTDPVSFPCPESDELSGLERHWRNVHLTRKNDADYFCAQVFQKAADWLRRNRTHEDFYLHLDVFDPHEPWDPPEALLKMFDPNGYSETLLANPPYAPWKPHISEDLFNSLRARYAAKVVFLDHWLGHLLDTMDTLDLWKDTLVIFTSDHGTYNGDHDRMGKMQTHQFDAVGHIPFIMSHPEWGHGEDRDQLVQLVDIYPTTLAAVGKPLPGTDAHRPIHGINLLPTLEEPKAHTRDYAISGQFGQSISITDARWILHQAPVPENQPLNWHGHCLAKFIPAELGPYEDGKRRVLPGHPQNAYHWGTPTWLSNKLNDINELQNLADRERETLHTMQRALKDKLLSLQAPEEQLDRLGLRENFQENASAPN